MPGAEHLATNPVGHRSSDPASGSESVESEATSPVVASVLEHLLHELSLRERLVVSLRFADDLAVPEIAYVLHATTDEVERILAHAASRVQALVATA